MVLSPRHEAITAAACDLIARSISLPEIQLHTTVAPWRKIVDFGLRSRSTIVQEATANALMAVSKLVDCSPVVNRWGDFGQLLLGSLLTVTRSDYSVRTSQGPQLCNRV